jgi:hypothetical protein
MSGKLYHIGFQSRIARSTLADANETHDWRVFADFAWHLIGVARPLHAAACCRNSFIVAKGYFGGFFFGGL